MVGLGEEWDEVVADAARSAHRRAARSSPSASTCGRRSRTCRWSRYYTPAEFAELKRIGLELGFGHVESGPLVRSSYHAHEQTESLRAAVTVERSAITQPETIRARAHARPTGSRGQRRRLAPIVACTSLRAAADLLPADRARQEGRASRRRLLGRPVPGFGDPRCARAGARPRACRARRQPHRPRLHRRRAPAIS